MSNSNKGSELRSELFKIVSRIRLDDVSERETEIDNLMELIESQVRQARIDEMKMMRELLHLFNVSPIELMRGKTPANEYIKKRLLELQSSNKGIKE